MTTFEQSGQAATVVSVTDKVRPLALGAPVTAVHFLKDRAFFVGAEEGVMAADAGGEITKIPTHGGGILCAASDGSRIVMGGDDGRLVALDAKGETKELVSDPKRRWVDNVALHPDGAVAWSVGKVAYVRSGKNEDKFFEVTSTVGGLAFAPKG